MSKVFQPSVSIHESARVASDARFVGSHPVRVLTNAIVHPLSIIDSSYGPVEIGSGSIVCERCIIRPLPGKSDLAVDISAVLGSNCLIEVGARLHGSSVGDGSKVGVAATVGANARIGVGCSVGACVSIPDQREVPDSVCVYLDDGGDPDGTRVQRFRVAPYMKQAHEAEAARRRALLQDPKSSACMAKAMKLKKSSSAPAEAGPTPASGEATADGAEEAAAAAGGASALSDEARPSPEPAVEARSAAPTGGDKTN